MTGVDQLTNYKKLCFGAMYEIKGDDTWSATKCWWIIDRLVRLLDKNCGLVGLKESSFENMGWVEREPRFKARGLDNVEFGFGLGWVWDRVWDRLLTHFARFYRRPSKRFKALKDNY